MVAKFVVVLAFVAVAAASDISSFSYGVADPSTGDFKGQAETRVGDSVRGQYSLLESDGTKRTVDYAADAASGFNAVVRKDPAVFAAAPIAPIAPIAYNALPYSAYPYGYKFGAYPYAFPKAGFPYTGFPSGYPYAGYPYAGYPYGRYF